MAGRLSDAVPGPDIAPPLALPTAERLPILAVDDRRQNLVALEAVLAPLGLPLVTAASGDEALRLLLERDFALILLDVRMPGLGGIETAQMIKSRERTRDVPIVFLTAARDEVGEIVRGYGVGAVDYVLRPLDPELLRSKVAVFAELEHSRRALRRSEAFLRGAFEAAPIGKTVLDVERRIVHANPAFARLVGRRRESLTGRPIDELCHPDERATLSAVLDRVGDMPEAGADIRLERYDGAHVWVAATASAIAPTDLTSPLLLVQWVDLSTRRRAEQARAELLLEQAARGHAEAEAARLQKLQRLVEAVESRSVRELTAELARRLAEVFEADAAEIELDCGTERRSATFRAGGVERSPPAEGAGGACEQALLTANRTEIGVIRLSLAPGQTLDASDRALLRDAAEQISLLVRRMQLHEQEHRIAVELQRGLLPARLPELPGVAVAAHYEAAGLGAEVGGDWYDAFLLPGDRLGVVIGDVTGSGIQAASAMVQLRSVTRAFALGDPDPPSPAEVLTRLHRYSQKLGFEDLFTVVYLILDPGEETVTWANAGHPPPMQRTAGGEVRMLAAGESMMVDADIAYRDHQASVTDGDTLILYTDGLIERRGETIDAGLERLATAVRTGPPGADALCEHIVTANPASGAPLHDDVTALVLALTPLMVDVAAANGRDASADRVEVVLPPDSHAPADARALLEKSFGHALERGELERAKLAVSELATNAVRHGRGEITIRAELGRERLLVEVIDEGPGFEPIVHEPELEQLGGWGLNIVDVDTSRWGMREGTTHVWFEIERGARPPSVVSRITSPGFCG